jgi:diguanylate cyclase (GGDEF)-like protein
MSSNLANFWRSYVHIGVVTYSMGALAVILYAVATPGGPYRRAMAIVGCLSLAASIGPFKWLGLRLVATRWSTAFFSGWAACTFVFIALGAILDGGVRSPISYFLVLPMLFAGLAYSAGTVSLLAAFGVAMTLVVGVLTPHRSWSSTAFLAVALVIAGVITAAAAINRDRLIGQLLEAASVDSLTGCLSRGAFQERLEEEARRSRRHPSSFSLIVADVDDLKSLNDSGGHDSGDRALRLLVGVLCRAARESDVVGRLGGDEFAMLLLDSDQNAALDVATRLNEALQAVTGSDSVTACFGVSPWLGAHDSPDALLRRADEALYVAKRAGRNRAALWDPSSTEAPPDVPWPGRRPRRTAGTTRRP